jgi:hypothetical protein
MVLSVQGDIKLRPMDMLRSGELVRLPASAKVRLVFLADGHRETLNPGGTIEMTPSGGKPDHAVKRENTKLSPSQLDGLKTMAASARAAVSLARDPGPAPPPLSPIASGFVLQDRPSFAWAALPGSREYEIKLFRGVTDQKESLVWSVKSPKEHLEYPKAQPALARGETYLWEVSVAGQGLVAMGTFTVASSEQASDLEPIRKLSQSTELSDRLLAATVFEAALVYDESSQLFEDLARQLPAEPWVLRASARHLARLGKTDEARSREKKALELSGRKR